MSMVEHQNRLIAVRPDGTLTWRTLEDRFLDVVNVKDFGAVGDGVTNDTVAIQAALNAVPATGGRVEFPSAVYRTTGVTLPQPASGGITLKGLGGGAILYNSANGAAFHTILAAWATQAVYPVVIEDIALTSAGTNGWGFKGTNLTGAVFNRVKAYNNGIHGIGLDTSYAARFHDCLLWSNKTDGLLLATQSGNNAVISSCRFLSNGSAGTGGAGLEIAGTASNVGARNCDFEANYLPINVNGAVTGLIVRDSYFENGGTPSGNPVLYVPSTPSMVVFDGNYVQDYATAFANITGLTVSDNFWNNASPSIGAAISNLVAYNNVGTGTTVLPAGWSSAFAVGGKLSPATDAGVTQAGSVYQGSGVPNNANGANGDVYFRTDTPGTVNQRLYVRAAGAWVGIL